jgi:hypothetical protein
MSGGLSRDEVERYQRDGFLFPLRALAEGEAHQFVERVAEVERRFRDRYPVGPLLKNYPMYLLPFVDELVRRASIVDAVESVLGPDVMVWAAEFFIKEARSPKFVSWHQDLTYWGLSDAAEVTAWVALSEATVANGCMRMIPGSHAGGIVPHRDTFAADNILSRGQEVVSPVDESRATAIELRPGEMSLHHGRMFHSSGPNDTDARRIGLVVRYIAPSMRQTVGRRDYAALVRGEDRYRHFITPPRPVTEFSPEAIELVSGIEADTNAYLYATAEQAGHRHGVRGALGDL